MIDFGTEKKQCFDDHENGSLIIVNITYTKIIPNAVIVLVPIIVF